MLYKIDSPLPNRVKPTNATQLLMITPLLTREASLGEKAATNTGSKAKAKAAAAPLI